MADRPRYQDLCSRCRLVTKVTSYYLMSVLCIYPARSPTTNEMSDSGMQSVFFRMSNEGGDPPQNILRTVSVYLTMETRRGKLAVAELFNC